MAAAASVAAAAAASVTSSRHGSQDADDEDNPGLGDRQSGDDPDADAEQMIVDRLPYQARVRQLYASQPTTTAIALLIFINFVISAVDKQINPLPGSTSEVAINGFELFFALIIVEGVGAALPGVGNAFVLLGLLMGI
ncbi:hypothetical protein T492DRAFT_886023, partial [Pavlovales sp. CCMP2436]